MNGLGLRQETSRDCSERCIHTSERSVGDDKITVPIPAVKGCVTLGDNCNASSSPTSASRRTNDQHPVSFALRSRPHLPLSGIVPVILLALILVGRSLVCGCRVAPHNGTGVTDPANFPSLSNGTHPPTLPLALSALLREQTWPLLRKTLHEKIGPSRWIHRTYISSTPCNTLP